MLGKHGGEVVTTLRPRRTPDGLVAKLTRLSDFLTAIVDTAKATNSFVASLKPFIDEVTAIQGGQPNCVGRELKLEDDSTVKTAELSQEDILWPCVELGDGRVRVTVHNVSAAPWRIRSASGSYDGAAQPELADAAKQALVTALTTDKAHNDGYVPSQSSGRWTVDLDELPSGMAGRVSLGMYLAEVTVFAAVMIASLPARGTDAYLAAGTVAQGIAGLSEDPRSEAWSCIVRAGKAVADGLKPDLRTLGALTRAALSCVGADVRAISGASLNAQVLKSNDSYFPVGATLPMRFEHDRQILVFGDDSDPRNVGYFRLCADPDRIPTDSDITAECGA